MSDREFENYLTLIGRLLRLSAAQREAIGAELRDHFESRLTELTSRGISHDAAAQIALQEFGEAAGLAAQFSRIAQTRKRRLIMRCTLASAAALAAALVVAISLWPENHAPLNHAVGQTAEKKNVEELEKAAQAIPDSFTAMTNAKLDRFIEVNFADNPAPLNDFVSHWLKEALGVEGYVDQEALKEAGIDPNATLVSFPHLSHIRGKMFLELLLKQWNLGYTVRDGIVIISTRDRMGIDLLVRVYDCREILAAYDGPRAKRVIMGGGAFPFAPDKKDGDNGEKKAEPKVELEAPAPMEALIDAISSTVEPESWTCKGGQGSIQPFSGLVIISQTQEVQEKVADLLEQIKSRLVTRAAK
jgi:hypothetical protein